MVVSNRGSHIVFDAPQDYSQSGSANLSPRSGDGRGATRNQFLARGVGIGGALVGFGALSGPLASGAASRGSPAGDVTILNFALFLEYIEEALYKEAVERGKLPGELAEYARTVYAHEQAHVAFIQKALGAKARKPPRLRFGVASTNPQAFTTAAITLEDTIVAAYNGQAVNLTTGALAAAARIASVEARHAAWIRAIAGLPPALHATDRLESAAIVLATIRRTGFVTS
jgi:hypothetical protein